MKFKNLFLLIFVFILFSCSFTPNENKSQNNSENDTILEDVLTGEVLETESLFEDKEDTSTVLNVIDERYWTSQGSTLWTVLEDIPCVMQKTFEVTTSKLSGAVEAGYGIIFGHTENHYGNCMLIFLINNQGEYAIGELKGTVFNYFVKWKKHEKLNQGYNVENTLKVALDNKYRYAFYINDEIVHYLYSPTYSGHLQGKNGYIAVVSPKDRLPDETVTVQYKLK